MIGRSEMLSAPKDTARAAMTGARAVKATISAPRMIMKFCIGPGRLENHSLTVVIYEPDMLVIMDDTLVSMPNTYAGLKPGGIVLINSAKPLDELLVPDCAGLVAAVDATEISERRFGKNLPNTSVLGAFARIVDLVEKDVLFEEIASAFGDANRLAAEEGYESVRILKGEAAK